MRLTQIIMVLALMPMVMGELAVKHNPATAIVTKCTEPECSQYKIMVYDTVKDGSLICAKPVDMGKASPTISMTTSYLGTTKAVPLDEEKGYCTDTQYMKIGSNTIIVEYKEIAYHEFNSSSIDVQYKLYVNETGEYSIVASGHWVEGQNKFGYNVTGIERDARYKIEATSSLSWQQEGTSVKAFLSSGIFSDEYFYSKFDDVCTEGCNISVIDNVATVEFIGHYNSTLNMTFIDPTILIVNMSGVYTASQFGRLTEFASNGEIYSFLIDGANDMRITKLYRNLSIYNSSVIDSGTYYSPSFSISNNGEMYGVAEETDGGIKFNFFETTDNFTTTINNSLHVFSNDYCRLQADAKSTVDIYGNVHICAVSDVCKVGGADNYGLDYTFVWFYNYTDKSMTPAYPTNNLSQLTYINSHDDSSCDVASSSLGDVFFISRDQANDIRIWKRSVGLTTAKAKVVHLNAGDHPVLYIDRYDNIYITYKEGTNFAYANTSATNWNGTWTYRNFTADANASTMWSLKRTYDDRFFALYSYNYTWNNRSIFIAESNDNGTTWNRSLLVELNYSATTDSTAFFVGASDSTLTYDNSTTDLYVSYFNWSNSKPYIIRLNITLSPSNGTTPEPPEPTINTSKAIHYFDAQIPSDINGTNAITRGVNITYNLSQENITTNQFLLFFRTNTSDSNITRYINGSSSYHVGGYFNHSPEVNTSTYNKYRLFDNEVYPATYNIEPDTIENTAKTTQTIATSNTLVGIELLNVSNSSRYNFFEAMVTNISGTNAARIYYCNSSYNPGTNTSVATSANCILFYSLPAQPWNHCHNGNLSYENISCHMVIPMSINTTTGKLGTVKVTQKSYFWIRGQTGVTWRAYLINQSMREDYWYTTNNNGANTLQVDKTVDSHLHQFNQSWELCYYEYWNYTAYGSNYENMTEPRCDLLDIAGLPPNVFIYSPTNQTYTVPFDINYSAISPNSYPIKNYTIILLNSSMDHNLTLKNQTTLTGFYWNWTQNTSSGLYYVKVLAYDNMSQEGMDISEQFQLLVTEPNNVSLLLNSVQGDIAITYPAGLNATASCKGGEATLYRNGTNVTSENNQTINLSAGTYFYNATCPTTGNYTFSYAERYVNISKANGLIRAYVNATENHYTSDNGTDINITGILITGTGTIQLWLNGTNIKNGSSPLTEYANLSVYVHNFTAIYPGNENYTYDEEYWNINITTGVPAPTVNISPYFSVFTLNQTNVYTDGYINVTGKIVNGTFPLLTYIIYLNSTYEINRSNASYENFTYYLNASNYAPGNYNISAWVNDTGNLTNVSEVLAFNISVVPPVINTSPYFLSFTINQTSIEQNSTLNVSFEIRKGTFDLHTYILYLNSTYEINRSNATLENFSYYLNTSTLNLGSYNISGWVNDTMNMTNISTVRTFTVITTTTAATTTTTLAPPPMCRVSSYGIEWMKFVWT